MMDERESGLLKPCKLHPTILPLGFLLAGIVSFGREGVVASGMADIFPSFFGAALVSVAFLAVIRARSVTRVTDDAVDVISFACFLIGCILVVVAHLEALGSQALLFVAAALVGLAVPRAVVVWLDRLSHCDFRSICLNAALAYAVCVGSVVLLYALDGGMAPYCEVLLLLAGIVPAVAFRVRRGGVVRERNYAATHEDGARCEPGALLIALCSIPVLGLALSALSLGLPSANAPTLALSSETSALIACGFFLILSMAARRVSDRELAFKVFALWIPSAAIIAIVLKLIPLAFV